MTGLRDHPVGPVIPVSDLTKARAFYEGLLGLEGEEVPGGWALHAGGGTRVFLLVARGDAGQADWPLASFESDDLDATVADLTARGARLQRVHDTERQTDPRGIADLGAVRIAWLRDPDRQVVALYQRTDAAAGRPTAVVRALFAAYLEQDRATTDALLADDFCFTSPQADRLDKAAYLQWCFPIASQLRSQVLLHVVAVNAEDVAVLYEYELKTGERFRNTEVITVRDGKVAEIQTFFGGAVRPEG